MHFLWAFTLEKRGGKNKEHICPLSCVDHSPPFNTNFSKLISSQLLHNEISQEKISICCCKVDHTPLPGEAESCEAAAARPLLSSAAQVQRGWCGWGAARVGEEGRTLCMWVKEKKRVAAREIPSATQLLLGSSSGHIPTARAEHEAASLKIWIHFLRVRWSLKVLLLEWASFFYKRIHLWQ